MISFAGAMFALACLLAMFFTTWICRLAPRIGLVDYPDNQRKLHRFPVPLGGGVAVFLATALVLAGVIFVPNPWGLNPVGYWREIVGFGLACLTIVLLGLADDRFGLRGRHKLLGQVAAASFLMIAGLIIRGIGVFGYELELGLLSIPFTLFWLVGATNAINLLDGIDGLAATLGIVLSGTIAVMAAMTHHSAVAVVALVFAGSLLGFLRYNFPPAKIFLGDAGSMLIGLMIGAMAIRGSLKSSGTILLAAPLAVWTLPAFDSAMALLRRKLTGRSIYATDRGHLHHRLLDALGTNNRVLGVVATAAALTCAGALLSLWLKNDLVASVACAGIMLTFVATGLFGRAEMALLVSRLRRAGISLVRPASNGHGSARQSSIRLQGSRDWELLWQTVTESAEKLCLVKAVLDLNLPAIRESYNAAWDCGRTEEVDGCWCMELPLVLGEQTVGRLSVRGKRNGRPAQEDIVQLLEMLEPFEDRLRDFAAELGVSSNRPLQVVS